MELSGSAVLDLQCVKPVKSRTGARHQTSNSIGRSADHCGYLVIVGGTLVYMSHRADPTNFTTGNVERIQVVRQDHEIVERGERVGNVSLDSGHCRTNYVGQS